MRLLRVAALRGQRGDGFVHVLDRNLVHAPIAEKRKQPIEGHTVQDAGSLAHVHARGLPPLSGLPKCRRPLRLPLERRQIRDAQRGELAVDPAPARERLSLRLEAAGVTSLRLAAAEPVTDEEALAAVLRRAGDDPAGGTTRSPSPAP
jgi:hypothetical protein